MKYFISQYWKIIVGLISIFIGGLGFGGVLESLRHRDDPPPPSFARPDRDWIRSTLASLGVKAMIGGMLASCLSASIAGILFGG